MAKINTKVGDLRYRVQFLSKTLVADGSKGNVSTWNHYDFDWAEIMPLSGRERFFTHQIKTEVTHRIRTRYRTDVNEQMRIKYNDRYFLIESMIDINERRRFLEFMCIEDKGIVE